MTALTKNFTKFASLMVALSIMLGLAVTGCSESSHENHDSHDDGQVERVANITYNFVKNVNISPKASEEATNVVLTAFDADGTSVYVRQKTQIISSHKNITPSPYDDNKFYEGTAKVRTTAVKLVLSYFDKDGEEIGFDVLDNVTVQEGDVFDFAEDVDPLVITWTPADQNIKLAVGDTLRITATDAGGKSHLIRCIYMDGYFDFNEETGVLTALAPTPDDMSIPLGPYAFDESGGKTVATTVYYVTVTEK